MDTYIYIYIYIYIGNVESHLQYNYNSDDIYK